MKTFMHLSSLIFLFLGCESSPADSSQPIPISTTEQNVWEEHWYDGKAEVNVYQTEQARYNDIHPGKTVLVFVTEDFLTEKQVKNEGNSNANSTSVLKTNMIRTFQTGLYDYSMMTSVFTPVDNKKYPKTLKINLSSQDWCGQSFVQLNHKKNKYEVHQYSYFEKEGDKTFNVDDVISEDEIFNRLRINPEMLPTGAVTMLPSLAFARLKHIDYKPCSTTIVHDPYQGSDFSGEDLSVYKIEMPTLDRTLEIVHQKSFPYNIVGWKDTYTIMSGEKLSSIFRKTSSERLSYWNNHDLADSPLRDKLGL